ncbi:PREDICTED: dispanin subfamily A member 2b-like [Cyprinodon variegatus]|uniref:Dispanin subfamily A member 2b-like n=1 Tax=Cyprinodon variegatus TaxID=28743 RepID=A0A3Q2D348_CYPVA|nr:PREDICTED: dispanin subfamily A member 2b-like [Cyprinodon variegatus]
MNPGAPSKPFLAVPMQYSSSPGSESAGKVQHTAIKIPAEPPRDHFVWSLFNFFYGNLCCLGLVAVVFSVRARDWKVLGDLNRARSSASTARNLNITATVLLILAVVLYIATFIAARYRH